MLAFSPGYTKAIGKASNMVEPSELSTKRQQKAGHNSMFKHGLDQDIKTVFVNK